MHSFYPKDVAKALDGLPKNKMHCSNLGADALHIAIQDYEDKQGNVSRPGPKRKEEHLHHAKDENCYCPYCDVEISDSPTFCQACQRDLTEEHKRGREMRMSVINLDHISANPLPREVKDVMIDAIENDYHNPSSQHMCQRRPKADQGKAFGIGPPGR